MRSQILRTKFAMASQCLRLFVLAILSVLFSSFHSEAQNMHKPSVRDGDTEHQCVNNLTVIYKMIKLHLHHSAGVTGFPTDLDEIYLMTKDSKLFICPSDKQIKPNTKPDTFRMSYEVVNDPLKPSLTATPPDRIAIIAEIRPNHKDKRFVLFYDGSVRAFNTAQFDKLKSDSFIDIGADSTKH